MVVHADQQVDALATLARAVSAAAQRPTLVAALGDLAEAARRVTGADLVLVRVPAGDRLEAVAAAGPAALAAELDGTALPASDLPGATISELVDAPQAVQHAAARAGARALLVVPVRAGDASASLELYRATMPFDGTERIAAELAGAETALVLRAFAGGGEAIESLGRPALELAGEALAAAFGEVHVAADVLRLAATVVGAPAGVLWEIGDDGLEPAASHGLDAQSDLAPARALAEQVLAEPGLLRVVEAERLPGGCGASTALPLGQPPVGVLQLLFAADATPETAQLGRLTTFGVRAAHALRTSVRTRSLAVELERTRALLAVVGQATAELSLTHTLETAVERVAALLAVQHVAVYRRVEDRLVPTASSGLTGPHARVAERLLELSFGARGSTVVDSADIAQDTRLRDVRDAADEAGIAAALAAPLVVQNVVIGLLAVYPEQNQRVSANEASLLEALAGQLAVALQNAQLHEQTTVAVRQKDAALAKARDEVRRRGALLEISRSFSEDLSLDKMLDALAKTIVDVLGVDAAVIGMPDERRESLVPRAIHVRDEHLADAAKVILWRPQPFGATAVQRLFREGVSQRVERGHELLEPFLAKGWTAAAVPVATATETISALTIFSFSPGSPIDDETIDSAIEITVQAALAIDNARLYQQQKAFADTMQRSLLPREHPSVPGLEVAEVYESSARVDVGGDVYDFVELPGSRLAVVLGDVTGHGVEATADMAMAKFVFRSLAREHPDPGEFLAFANDVVVDEIAPGKFITMTYLAVDGQRGEVACANAGHPAPRLVLPDGTVRGLDASGLVLGIEPGQDYEEVREQLPVGAAIVLYTDGVVEARSEGELYGTDRLDALLAEHREDAPATIARLVCEDARSYAGGELSDDVAVVVIKRLG